MQPISLQEMATVYITLLGIKKPTADIAKARDDLAKKLVMAVAGIFTVSPSLK